MPIDRVRRHGSTRYLPLDEALEREQAAGRVSSSEQGAYSEGEILCPPAGAAESPHKWTAEAPTKMPVYHLAS